MNRRRFLSQTSALAATGSVPSLWRRAAAAAAAVPRSDAPILVVVELTGGNDGLNTVIPYRDDAYHRARPTLHIAPDKVLKLDDTVSLHPAMTGLHKLWGKGKLRVLTNVGYPKPNRSHTRSMEIWQSGVLESTPTSGWLGRVADRSKDHAPSCHVGSGSTPLAIVGRDIDSFALSDIDGMKLRLGSRLVSHAEHVDASPEVDQVSRAIAAAGVISAKVAAMSPDDPSIEHESLDAKLTTIRGLIESGVGIRVFYTSLGGFDTHGSQQYQHQDLLRKLSAALTNFQSELEAKKLDSRVVVLVFSEFGRRVEENGSKGTDHGAAAPVLLLGSPVAGGLYGGAPDLVNLDEGDIRYTLDFRDVYAALLKDWLHIDPSAVIGRGKDERLRFFQT